MGCCDGVRRGVHRAAGTMGNGIRGLSRAAMRADLPAWDTLAERSRECFGERGRSAPCAMLGLGLFCRACGCLAMAKVRVASEACPLGKWREAFPERSLAEGPYGGSRATVRPPDV